MFIAYNTLYEIDKKVTITQHGDKKTQRSSQCACYSHDAEEMGCFFMQVKQQST